MLQIQLVPHLQVLPVLASPVFLAELLAALVQIGFAELLVEVQVYSLELLEPALPLAQGLFILQLNLSQM